MLSTATRDELVVFVKKQAAKMKNLESSRKGTASLLSFL
jgi:hypothetical protein